MTDDHRPGRPRLGCVIPNGGPLLARESMATLVAAVEEGGAEGAWFSDHLVVVEDAASVHPYSPSADEQVDRVRAVATPWYEALACCAFAAAVPSSLGIGTAVLVLPQRNPIEVAKVAATLDRLSGGRFVLGVGAGWLREEFALLGHDFTSRAERFEAGIGTIRDCWSGVLTGPGGLRAHTYPVPQGVPILLGGNHARALRRAAALGDGWLGIATSWSPYLDELDRQLEVLAGCADRAAGFTRTVRVVQRDRTDRDELLDIVSALATRPIDEIVVEPAWRTPAETVAVLREVREATDPTANVRFAAEGGTT